MLTKPVLARSLFGLVFYFFDDPGSIRRTLSEIISKVLSQPFFADASRLTTDGERYRPVKGTAQSFAISLVEEHDFEKTLFWSLNNSSAADAHTTRFEFLGRRLSVEYPGRSPNYLYLELPSDFDPALAWELFSDFWSSLPFYLAYGNRVIAPHPEQMPRSGSAAAKMIRSAETVTKGFWEVWGNPDYGLIIGDSVRCIESANQFVGLGREITSEFRDVCGDPLSIDSFFAAELDGVCLFRADDETQRLSMNSELSGIFCDLPRPTMFWKPEQWNEWVAKVRR